jgi:hypothetical protein
MVQQTGTTDADLGGDVVERGSAVSGVSEARQRRVEDLVAGGPVPDGRVADDARFDARVRHGDVERYRRLTHG